MPVRSKFEGFFLGDATQTVRLGDNTRICREQAVDVGVDFADISVQGCRERDCGRIRSATAQRGDVVIFGDSLEPCDDGNVAVFDGAGNAFGYQTDDLGTPIV